MIKEVKMYTVICDNCGGDSNYDNEYSCYSEQGYAEECAFESGWIEHDGEHYCELCYEYDDEDNLVINENRKGHWDKKKSEYITPKGWES